MTTKKLAKSSGNPFLELMGRWQRDPLAFVREAFGATPKKWQRESLEQYGRILRGEDARKGISLASCNSAGKGLPITASIPTPTGERLWGSLAIGDFVWGPDSQPTMVTGVFDRGTLPVFRVTFTDGSSTVVDGEHLWAVEQPHLRRKTLDRRIVSTAEMMQEGLTYPGRKQAVRKFRLPAYAAPHYAFRPIPEDPYCLGVWLGDGDARGNISSADVEIRHALGGRWRRDPRRDTLYVGRVTGLSQSLRTLGLYGKRSWEKAVPKLYMENALSVRLAVLQGLLDTDGTVDKLGRIEFCSVSEQLANDVAWLVRSLGSKASVSAPHRKTYTYNGERRTGRPCYRVSISSREPCELFRLSRKRNRTKVPAEHRTYRWIKNIRPEGKAVVRCISVAHPSQTHLINDFILTHNTCFIAWLGWHNLLCFYPSRTVVTAPSKPQAYDVFLSEFSHWGEKLAPDLRRLVEIAGESASLKGSKEFPDAGKNAFLTIQTARKENPEAMQGVHTKEGRVLGLGDEFSGVDEDAVPSFRGLLSGKNAAMVLISNPKRRTGYFYDTHHTLKGLWYTKQISYLDVEDADLSFVEETRLTYGEDSNEFRVYCLGQFPTQDDNAIIPFDLIDAATRREVVPFKNAPVIWGLDVARSLNRDRSALCKRKGDKVLEPVKTYRLDNEMVLCGRIVEEYQQTPLAERPMEILIDSVGLGGGVVDRLAEVGLPARGINVSELPAFSIQRKYAKLRDELWYRARDWFMAMTGSIPASDTALIEELQLPCRDWDSANEYIKVEPKEKTRQRGKHISPDVADAFVLTFASEAASLVGVGGRSGSPGWGEPLRRNLGGIV